MKKLILLSTILILTILQFCLFLYTKKISTPIPMVAGEIVTNSLPRNRANQDLPRHSAYFMSKKFYDNAYIESDTEDKSTQSGEKIYGGIIPHHLIVKNNIAAFFSQLESVKYSTVVLVGPNHFEEGQKNIITSRAIWDTPFGDIKPNLKLIYDISKLDSVEINEYPFQGEHSISGLVGFIKKSLPGILIVPIILSQHTSEEEVTILAENIYRNTNKESTLVLASVDFSHYLPAKIAEFHDERSVDIIKTFDYDRIYGMEIDSPPSIFTLLKYLELAESKKAKLLYHSNSGTLTNMPDEPTTSHNIFSFTRGQEQYEKPISMMFFGDIMLDRYIGEVIERKGVEFLFSNITSGENRFFRGVDIIGGNLEGAVTDSGEHYPPELVNDFAFSREVVGKLRNYNFNYFNIANNHISDQGIAGVRETKKNLNALNLNFSGCIDKNVDEECSSTVMEVGNKKVGLIGLSMVYGSFDIETAKKIVKNISTSSDFTVVNIHWGQEYKHKFNKKQQTIAHSLIDSGASIIIGHHPHVTQGIEIYKEKAIFYSLGNFIFDQPETMFPSDNSESLAIGINFNNNKQSIYLIPTIFKSWQLDLMKNKEVNIFLEKIISWSSLDDKYINDIKKGIIEL